MFAFIRSIEWQNSCFNSLLDNKKVCSYNLPQMKLHSERFVTTSSKSFRKKWDVSHMPKPALHIPSYQSEANQPKGKSDRAWSQNVVTLHFFSKKWGLCSPLPLVVARIQVWCLSVGKPTDCFFGKQNILVLRQKQTIGFNGCLPD